MDILVTIATLIPMITDLTDDQSIIARDNYLDSNFKDDLSVVDSLLNTPIGRSDSFDGDNESFTFQTYRKTQMTVDFYGVNAEVNANTFEARLNSQITHEFSRDNEIEIFNNKTVQNIKNIQGKTVYDRFQIEIVVKYNQTVTDDVLRIDTAVMEVHTEDKIYDVETPSNIN